MPIFIQEDNTELHDKTFPIPQSIQNHLNATLLQNDAYSNCKGYKRLKTLVDNDKQPKQQNMHIQGEVEEHKPEGITYGDMKRIKNDFDTMAVKNNTNPSFVLNGGNKMKNWVDNTLQNARNRVKNITKQNKQKTREKNKMNVVKQPTKPIQVNGGEVHVQGINENKKQIVLKEEQLSILTLNGFCEKFNIDIK